MSNVFGKNFRVEIFGESHAAAIGAVIDGIPAGMEIDIAQIRQAMHRRAPSAAAFSTKRKETDEVEILCGLLDGKATGAPLCGVIQNSDAHSKDYDKIKNTPRPGHADFTAHIKYKGANDVRGGGYFSGRLTAPLVFAGSIARQFLAQNGITVGAHIAGIAGVPDDVPSPPSPSLFEAVEQKDFPVINGSAAANMLEKVTQAAAQQDSVGGAVRCVIMGLPAGLGEPFFDSAESTLSHILFSIPAVKGVEFGSGFAMAGMPGSEANDCPHMQGSEIHFDTNHSGGIMGGITNGMPIVFTVAIRPTPSIGKKQQTVDLETMQNCDIEIGGRHDACIVPRAVEVVKCAAAIAIADLYLESEKYKDL